MAVIETNPNQTKTVIALLGVLVVAIGVTVVRILPSQAVTAEAPAAAQSQAAPVSVTEEPAYDRSRNPFAKPAGTPEASQTDNGDHIERLPSGLPGFATRGGPGMNPYRQGGVDIQPVDPGSMPRIKRLPDITPKAAGSIKTGEPAGPRPVFTLMATMKGARGYSAIVRAGQSDVRVVEAGDLLEGGFKVEMIDDDRAVLSDGRQTIVAKRP